MLSFVRSPKQLLHERLTRAFEIVAGEPFDPLVQRSQHADYQANGALQLAERLGANPREVARRVLSKTDWDDLVDMAEVSGPRFYQPHPR
jgi:arginyl-tRNA synthetase